MRKDVYLDIVHKQTQFLNGKIVERTARELRT